MTQTIEAVKSGLTDEQRVARLRGMGGTDAGVIAGNPWKTRYQLWQEKTGRRSDERDNEAMYWGRVLEEAVATRYAEVTGHYIRRQPHLQSREYPFMLASVDRQICNDPRGPGVLEVKTANAWAEVTDEHSLPDHYYAQLQHYLIVTGYTWGAFAFLIGGQRFLTFEVTADADYQAHLIAQEEAFWRLVLTDTPPAFTAADVDTLRELYPTDNGETITLTRAEVELQAQDLLEVREQIKALEYREQELRVAILADLGSASIGVIPGWGQVSFKAAKPSEREVVDVARLKADYPDAAATCVTVKTTPGSRRFLLQPGKGI